MLTFPQLEYIIATMTNSLAKKSKKYLEDIVRAGCHNEYEDDETGEWIHSYFACEPCDAEKELNRREYVKNSKKPGRLPVSKNGSSSHNVLAKEVKIGNFARYLSKPGMSEYAFEYAEALNVYADDEFTVILWRKTNSDEKPFAVSYAATDNLSIVEHFSKS